MTAQQLSFDVGERQAEAIHDAESWRLANPQAWDAITAWAHEDYTTSGHCSMQTYMQMLREPRRAAKLYVHRVDCVYLVNHNLRAGLTRLIMREHPYLPFRPRKSMADGPMCPSARPINKVVK